MKKIKIENLSEYFLKKSEEDSEVAELLLKNRHYNEAIYFHCQSIEKKIKSEIYKRINPLNVKYEDYTHNHSLRKLMRLLIDVYVGDETTRIQMKKQTDILLKKIGYLNLNSALRYPIYDDYKKCYMESCYTEKDYKEIVEVKYEQLRKYIEEIFKAI